MSGRLALTTAAVALASVTFSACALGERPTLAEQAPVGDAAAQTVIDLLRRTPDGTFVATYVISPTASPEPNTATVTRTDDATVTAEIGEVVYTTNTSGSTTTCAVGGGNCESFANDARVSDIGVTHLFWGPAFERRLTTDTRRRVGTSTSVSDTISGQPATCAAVKVPSSVETVGTVTYCALDNGLLARYFGADVTIELTSFSSASG